MIACHLHNSRCGWIKTLGKEHGIPTPPRVERRTATKRELLPALRRSSQGILSLLALGRDHGGQLPPSKAYVWRNLPLDVAHVLTYFVAHEGHHRGQICAAGSSARSSVASGDQKRIVAVDTAGEGFWWGPGLTVAEVDADTGSVYDRVYLTCDVRT